ncbi:MAG: DUF2164 family protein [Candidatus Gracilibacteria bacterium]|nr:DUF2164 family protein [Candidatus Gracilibacteria bacterium]
MKMSKIKRKSDLLISKEKREKAIRETVDYFNNEQDQDIGMIAAEDILDFFLNEIGDEIYNKAIEDSKALLKLSSENLEINLDALSKR